MQIQHHVHAQRGVRKWPRGKQVRIRKDNICCEMAFESSYDLASAYSKDPHVQFINCKTEENLRNFVRAWGPLYIVSSPSKDEWVSGISELSITEYRGFQRTLRARKNLVEACKTGVEQRKSLLDFFEGEIEYGQMGATADWGDPLSYFSQLLSLEKLVGPQDDLIEWARNAPMSKIRLALAVTTELAINVRDNTMIKALPTTSSIKIEPTRQLDSLREALRWMVWFDEWNERPPQYCKDCRKLFRPLTSHERKFCDDGGCAHRVANRKWRKKDLARKKKGMSL